MSKIYVDEIAGIASADTVAIPGHVIQVVQTVKTDVFTTTSSSYVDVTGATVSITPSSTNSKILVYGQLLMGSTTSTATAYAALSRGGTLIGVGELSGSKVQASAIACLQDSDNYAVSGGAFLHVLDSPNTTSSVTYSIKVRTQAGYGIYVGRQGNDSDSDARGRCPTIITVQEIAG